MRPEMPEGVEWVQGNTAQSILRSAVGNYSSEDEHLRVDEAGRIVATNNTGDETLRSTLHVGRRAGSFVLVTETGVLLEVAESGTLRMGDMIYRRTPTH